MTGLLAFALAGGLKGFGEGVVGEAAKAREDALISQRRSDQVEDRDLAFERAKELKRLGRSGGSKKQTLEQRLAEKRAFLELDAEFGTKKTQAEQDREDSLTAAANARDDGLIKNKNARADTATETDFEQEKILKQMTLDARTTGTITNAKKLEIHQKLVESMDSNFRDNRTTDEKSNAAWDIMNDSVRRLQGGGSTGLGGGGGNTSTDPSSVDIEALQANPGMRDKFDFYYGAGAASKVLDGK